MSSPQDHERAELGRAISDALQVAIAGAVLTNERIARSFGLNVVDLQAYGVLARHGTPMTPSQLSEATELPTSTTTRVLDRLEAKAMVRRESDPQDRRKVWVHVESAQAAKVADSYGQIGRQLDAANVDFTTDELRAALRYLEAIKDIT